MGLRAHADWRPPFAASGASASPTARRALWAMGLHRCRAAQPYPAKIPRKNLRPSSGPPAIPSISIEYGDVKCNACGSYRRGVAGVVDRTAHFNAIASIWITSRQLACGHDDCDFDLCLGFTRSSPEIHYVCTQQAFAVHRSRRPG